ncbi:hypothetical protein ACFWP3_18935 [Streptomyces sp. NPDC058525]|uniref:hypothetical protein n=1 Tax=Streptomyces sp. NPDC058525 TaxID=3346538 RepID=UPI00365C8764
MTASIPLSLGPRPSDPAGAEDDDRVLTKAEAAPSTSKPCKPVPDPPAGRYVFIHREVEGE